MSKSFKNDLTGKKFNRFTVLNFVPDDKPYSSWKCECECGTIKTVQGNELVRGTTKSCGCLGLENKIKHNKSTSLAYSSWTHLKSRCNNPNNDSYKNYGGRGIKVCDRWLNSFENFLEDMGDRPSKEYSIDRIDNDGNYEPSNCRWSTKEEQNNNKRFIKYEDELHIITIDGVDENLEYWCDKYNISKSMVYIRLKKGMSVEEAITSPTIGTNRYITINNETKNLKEWCDEYNISYNSVYKRMEKGMSLVDAIITPKRNWNGL